MARKRKPQTIGQRIKSIRVAKKLTQVVVAERAEVSQGQLSQIESDTTDSKFSFSTLRKIAKALGCKVSELVD